MLMCGNVRALMLWGCCRDAVGVFAHCLIMENRYCNLTDVTPIDPRCMMMQDSEAPPLGEQQDDPLQPGEQIAVLTRPKTRKKRPSMYRVVLHNDDYTPMEFVVYILAKHFGKTAEAAQELMLAIHNFGRGVGGVFTYEIAETKASAVLSEARFFQHPLKCTVEEEPAAEDAND